MPQDGILPNSVSGEPLIDQNRLTGGNPSALVSFTAAMADSPAGQGGRADGNGDDTDRTDLDTVHVAPARSSDFFEPTVAEERN